MKDKSNKRRSYFIGLMVVIVIGSLSLVVMAKGPEPGSSEDPIVTQRYVEMRNEQLRFYIDESVKTLKDEILQGTLGNEATAGVTNNNVFKVVNVPKGKKLIAGASAEIILRAGKATVIDSELGGLCDMTSGVDLKFGQDVPYNHLLIVPRDDGRGANTTTDSVFMVKGSYSIK